MNRGIAKGQVQATPEFSHEVYNERFFEFNLVVARDSGYKDIVPCVVSEVYVAQITASSNIEAAGEVRTNNVLDADGKRKLKVYFFVKGVEVLSEANGDVANNNIIEIDGYTVKNNRARTTPLGREICDVLVASNRANSLGQSDYIPCVIWGRSSHLTSLLEIGTHIKIKGRFQSREYHKKLENGAIETRRAYEISAYKIEVVDE